VEEKKMKKLLLALVASAAMLSAPAMAQDKKLKIGATTYGLNAEFMQIWSMSRCSMADMTRWSSRNSSTR
jgi:ABC-type sugar transport system substrate-binding protein